MFWGGLLTILLALTIAEDCCDGIWIGYSYDSNSSNYTWEAGCNSTFEFWDENSPDDYGGSETYAAISYQNANGTWSDFGSYNLMECGCQTTAASCTEINGWMHINNSDLCYYISENLTDWDTCQTECGNLGYDMLCIEDFDQNDIVSSNMSCTLCEWYDYCDVVNVTCCPGLWIGYEQATTEGVWDWTDSSCASDYTNWDDGEPGFYGSDEFYAVIAEWNGAGTWYDVPGDNYWTDAACGCEIVTDDHCDEGWVSYNSSEFVQTCYYISPEMMNYGNCSERCANLTADMLCVLDADQNAFLQAEITCSIPFFSFPKCFWHDSHLREELLWYGIGVPCFIVMGLVVIHMGLVSRGEGEQSGKGVPEVRRVDLSVVTKTKNPSAYGLLLEMPYEESESVIEIRANCEVDETINRWLLRGAVGEVIFAIGLGGLGVTMLLHNERIEVSLFLDALEGFVCFCAKVVIVTSSVIVIQNLSQLSKIVAWYWIHIFAVAKLFMGLASFCIFVAYMIFGNKDDDPYTFCLAAHIFYSSLLSMIVFQTITGVALYGIYIRAVKQIGSVQVFYDIVGVWWNILVVGTFGVGVLIWLIGANFMIKEKRDGFRLIGTYFAFASFFQACAGASIFCINARVRAHFASSKGAKTIQMMEK